MLDPRKALTPERMRKVRCHIVNHSGEGYIGAVTLILDHSFLIILAFICGLIAVYIFAALSEG